MPNISSYMYHSVLFWDVLKRDAAAPQRLKYIKFSFLTNTKPISDMSASQPVEN
mgnify:CR=1 FL=1